MNRSDEPGLAGTILIVDDIPTSFPVLDEFLSGYGYKVLTALNGRMALDVVALNSPDIILMDVVMPELDGFETCRRLKANETTRDIPVIFTTSLTSMSEKVEGFEAGAVDYITKPYHLDEVLARVTAHLTIRDLQKSLQKQNDQLQREVDERKRIEAELRRSQERSEDLLLNILPRRIIERLKENPSSIAQDYDEVTVLFADIVDFSHLSAPLTPIDLINLLNDIFSTFDELAKRHGLEKIKTIGDAYMVVGGLPDPRPDHAKAIAEMALDMQQAITQYKSQDGEPFTMRIGINTGPVVAGIIGRQKFSYDLWGNTVNIASRMASQGVSGHSQVTHSTYERLQDQYCLIERGPIDVKGQGEMITYFLTGRLHAPSTTNDGH